MPKTLVTMTVGQLKKLLDQHDDDTLVGFAKPTHNYWKTVVVGEINKAEMGIAEYSEYDRAFRLNDPDPDQDPDEVGPETMAACPDVLILS